MSSDSVGFGFVELRRCFFSCLVVGSILLKKNMSHMPGQLVVWNSLWVPLVISQFAKNLDHVCRYWAIKNGDFPVHKVLNSGYLSGGKCSIPRWSPLAKGVLKGQPCFTHGENAGLSPVDQKGWCAKKMILLMTSQTVKNGGFYITNIMDLNGCPFFSFIIS